MKRKSEEAARVPFRAWPAAIIGFTMLIAAGQSYGEATLDIQALIRETQKMSNSPTQLTLVWWLPEQFWQASLAHNPNITHAESDPILKTLRPYTMIVVVDGQVGAFGGITYRSEEAVRANVTVKDAKGQSYGPISEDAIDPSMKNLIQMLKPIVANMAGPLGQNMQFLLFPAEAKDGQPLADPTREGMLDVTVAEMDFKFRLPLGSVLPPKIDPNTEETFPGNYNYNPFTGTKLTVHLPNDPIQRTQ
jgi:hypothetical protein